MDDLRLKTSPDGKEWTLVHTEKGVRLPEKLKVGVIADAKPPGGLKAIFDHFKFTPLGR